MPEATPGFPHVFPSRAGRREPYTNPDSNWRGLALPWRERAAHGQRLLGAIGLVDASAQRLQADRNAKGVSREFGILVEFESSPGFHLNTDSLNRRNSGIELLNVRKREVPIPETPREPQQGILTRRILLPDATDPGPVSLEGWEAVEPAMTTVTLATVLVPFGQLSELSRLVTEYINENTEKKNLPKNEALVASINQIREAALEAMWTEENVPFPDPAQKRWWEVWLRVGQDADQRDEILAQFRREAAGVGLACNPDTLLLPENTVLLAEGTGEQIKASIDLLNCLTELRLPGLTADFFVSKMTPPQRAELVHESVSMAMWPPEGAGAVCLLDTGVNRGHPLLGPALAPADCTAYNLSWQVDDHDGHGTQMAGLALYGDLVDVLGSSQPPVLRHRLESVKMLPPNGANDPQLYGKITAECVARAENLASQRLRTFCMTITTKSGRCSGRPSSWSAAIDQVCSGATEENTPRRLLVVSAGNCQPTPSHCSDYPAGNLTDEVRDPAQSWNALTVSTFTNKVQISADFPEEWVPLAPKGGLGPSATTSLTWPKDWPIKPDIVMEGGNMAQNPHDGSLDHHDSLQLLTTHREVQRLLALTGDTSAAAAQAARMAAMIQAEYPALWPETVRGLMVHSALWTPRMWGEHSPAKRRADKRALLRTYGYGVPDLGRALYSAANSLTLVCQDEIQPFALKEGKPKTNDLMFYTLPWPRAELEKLGNEPVQMRVTLSYFVEPNPGPRSTKDRYRYASCGLRFVVCRPEEGDEDFRRRINQEARSEEEPRGSIGRDSDSDGWTLGAELRHRGSVHSDIWKGSAIALAAKNRIAVYPVNGWWSLRRHLRRYESSMRYALLVTIKARKQDIDIYTPVVARVAVEV